MTYMQAFLKGGVSDSFLGRPRERMVLDKPSRATLCFCQAALPKGVPRFTLFRKLPNSSLVWGLFTQPFSVVF
jgi:hypothetical protein